MFLSDQCTDISSEPTVTSDLHMFDTKLYSYLPPPAASCDVFHSGFIENSCGSSLLTTDRLYHVLSFHTNSDISDWRYASSNIPCYFIDTHPNLKVNISMKMFWEKEHQIQQVMISNIFKMKSKQSIFLLHTGWLYSF